MIKLFRGEKGTTPRKFSRNFHTSVTAV